MSYTKIASCFLLLAILDVSAQDKITMSNGTVQSGTVTKVDANSVTLKMAAGEIALPRKDIKEIEIAKPADVDAALKAAEAKKCAEAIPALKAITDKFGGLPIPWVQQSLAALGDCQAASSQWPAALETYKRMLAYYPQTPYALKARVGLGQALVNEKKYDEAIKLVEEAIAPLRKELKVSDTDNRFLGSAMVVLGDCYSAKEEWDKALESYLSTVVLYEKDKQAVDQAKQKAEAIKEKIKKSA